MIALNTLYYRFDTLYLLFQKVTSIVVVQPMLQARWYQYHDCELKRQNKKIPVPIAQQVLPSI